MAKKKKLPPGVRERNGRFTFRYDVEVVKNGKKTRKQKETPSFRTAKEAYEYGILITADKLKGKLVDVKSITLGEWKEIWIEDYKIEREPAINTAAGREVGVRSLERFVGSLTKMKDITSREYQNYLNSLKKKGIKKSTIEQYHAACKLLFDDAVKKDVIADNPTIGAVIPASKLKLEDIENADEVPKYLEKEQLKDLLQIIRFRGRAQEYEIFLALAYTGLRINELLALKTSDFNEEQRTISVTKNLTIKKSVTNYVLGPPKNKSSIRKVSIGQSVIDGLNKQIIWRDKRIENQENKHDADFIFWSVLKPGFPASCVNLESRFKYFLDLAQLPSTLTPHSLRHTHVSLLAEAGEDLAVIQHRLGHKDDKMTRLVYLHVTKKRQQTAPDRFEKIMNL